jgi:hypothetical protein
VVFDNGIVFHSNLMGTHVEWYGSFVKRCTIVYQKEIQLSLIDEEAIFQSILNTYDSKGYDFGAFGYFVWCAILYRTIGKPFPTRNVLNSNDKFLCTELAAVLPDKLVSPAVKAKDLSIVSPYRLYQEIVEE